MHQQAKKVGLVGQRQALQGLEGGAHVEEACVLLAAEESAVEQRQRQMFHNFSWGRTEGEESESWA